MEETTLSTKNKALQINLNPQFYKTISAYDKTFSDVFYNKGKKGRYVSEQRLVNMLQMEFEELVSTLSSSRDDINYIRMEGPDLDYIENSFGATFFIKKQK